MSLEELRALVERLQAESEVSGANEADRERLQSLAEVVRQRLADPREDNQD